MPASQPGYTLEDQFAGFTCGVDEAGRGPLAGPVMAACVHIPLSARPHLSGLNDSKKLSAAAREKLDVIIRTHCLFGLAEASVAEIDEINILRATHLAMQRAFTALCASHHADVRMVFIDGNSGPKLGVPTTTVIGGDAQCMAIAAASILAKVARDKHMAALHETHPHYGWNRNAGYGVKAHMQGMQLHGVTIHHRSSFAPVRNLLSVAKS